MNFEIIVLGSVLLVGSFLADEASGVVRRFPAEWEPHDRCFMQWPASDRIWQGYVENVREDVASIARAIGKYERVTILALPEMADQAKEHFNSASNVDVLPVPVNDLWARDTMPSFVECDNALLAVDFNFNGWGEKQVHDKDKLVAAEMTKYLKLKGEISSLCGEGGSFETDGEGTLLVTESSMIHDKRNPNKSRDTIEAELKESLGLAKVIWLKGVQGEEITDGHVDCFVRFTTPGTVVLNRPAPGAEPDVWSRASDNALEILQKETDAKGRKFTIVQLPEPRKNKISGKGGSFVASYVNYYVANRAVVMPKFNDNEADNYAKETLQTLFPGREIVQVLIDHLARGGGGIHCATHEVPKFPN